MIRSIAASLVEAASSTCSICRSKSRRGSLCSCHHEKDKDGKGNRDRHPLQPLTVDNSHTSSPGDDQLLPSAASRRAFVSYKQETGPGGALELYSAVKYYLSHVGYAVVYGKNHDDIPACDLMVVLLSLDYLSDAACVAEAKAMAGTNRPLLCLHDTKFINLNQALDLGPLAFDLGLDALFRANVRGLHSRDVEGGFDGFQEELQRVLRPKPAALRRASLTKQKQVLVSYKPGGGQVGSREAYLMAKQLLKGYGFKVVQCGETSEARKPPAELRSALLTSDLAVVIVCEGYFSDAACRREASQILDSNLPFFPVHDAKHLSLIEALGLSSRAAKYDLESVFDREIVSLHSQEPSMFRDKWDDAIKKNVKA